jgi:hypothetical protein
MLVEVAIAKQLVCESAVVSGGFSEYVLIPRGRPPGH